MSFWQILLDGYKKESEPSDIIIKVSTGIAQKCRSEIKSCIQPARRYTIEIQNIIAMRCKQALSN
jgi:hypothetical protein